MMNLLAGGAGLSEGIAAGLEIGRRRRLAADELALRREAQDRAESLAALKYQQDERTAGLNAAIGPNYGVLADELGGRPYEGIPYQVPASEMGPGVDLGFPPAEGEAPAPTGLDAAVAEGPRLAPTPFRQPWESGQAMLAGSPRAAAAYGQLLQAKQDPFGKDSPLERPEVTRGRIEAETRRAEATQRLQTIFAGAAAAVQDPQQALGMVMQILSVLATLDPTKIPEKLTHFQTFIQSKTDVLENERAAQAALPFLAKPAAQMTDEDRAGLLNAVLEHPRATMREPLMKLALDRLQGMQDPREGAILGQLAQFALQDPEHPQAAVKQTFDWVLSQPDPGYRAALNRVIQSEKLVPTVMKNVLGLDYTAAEAEAKARGTKSARTPEDIAKEQAGVELTKAQTEAAKARTGRLGTPEEPGQAKNVQAAQLGLDRARRALADARKGDDDTEDQPALLAERQRSVEFWEGEVRRLEGRGDVAAPGRTSVKPYAELSAAEQKVRVDKLSKQKFQKPYLQLSPKEKAVIAGDKALQ